MNETSRVWAMRHGDTIFIGDFDGALIADFAPARSWKIKLHQDRDIGRSYVVKADNADSAIRACVNLLRNELGASAVPDHPACTFQAV